MAHLVRVCDDILQVEIVKENDQVKFRLFDIGETQWTDFSSARPVTEDDLFARNKFVWLFEPLFAEPKELKETKEAAVEPVDSNVQGIEKAKDANTTNLSQLTREQRKIGWLVTVSLSDQTYWKEKLPFVSFNMLHAVRMMAAWQSRQPRNRLVRKRLCPPELNKLSLHEATPRVSIDIGEYLNNAKPTIVLVQVLHHHHNTVNAHNYLHFQAFQEGAPCADDIYRRETYNAYVDIDTEEMMIAWDCTLPPVLVINVTSSYNIKGSGSESSNNNYFAIVVSGYID